MPSIVSRNLKQDNPDYPSALISRLGPKAPKQMVFIGSISILKTNSIAIICSEKSSLDQMIMVDGLIRQWCDEGKTMISGFHTKEEKTNVKTILEYQQPAVLCLGRAMTKGNVNKGMKKGLEDGRLLVLCPFENEPRFNAEMDLQRNLIVAALSNEILVAPVSGDSIIENFLSETNKWNIPTTILEMIKEVRNIDVGLNGQRYSVVKRVLPLFSKVEKEGQIIGDNGLGKVRPPLD